MQNEDLRPYRVRGRFPLLVFMGGLAAIGIITSILLNYLF